MKYLTTILIILILSNIIVIYDTSKITTRKRTQDGQMGEPTNRGGFVHSKEKEYYEETVTEVTAYTLSIDETDSDPTVGACGSMLNQHFLIVACPRKFNCGDTILINEIEYTCWDKMALKNDGKFDILMDTKEQAFKFGRREMIIKIIK